MTSRPIRTTYMAFMAACLCSLQGVAWGQAVIQAGRALDGTLILTDRGLPNDVVAAPLTLDQLMSLPEAAQIRSEPINAANPSVNASKPTSPPKQTAEQRATCRNINQRYAETEAELALVERKKAAGTLLIPESGLLTLRQNLATMERMRQLCQ